MTTAIKIKDLIVLRTNSYVICLITQKKKIQRIIRVCKKEKKEKKVEIHTK